MKIIAINCWCIKVKHTVAVVSLPNRTKLCNVFNCMYNDKLESS